MIDLKPRISLWHLIREKIVLNTYETTELEPFKEERYRRTSWREDQELQITLVYGGQSDW